MDETQYADAVKSHNCSVLRWSLVWAFGFLLLLGITFGGIAGAHALLGSGASAIVGVLFAILDCVYANSYFGFVWRLARSRGLVCSVCGKGLLSGRNRNLGATGRCCYCGSEVFKMSSHQHTS